MRILAIDPGPEESAWLVYDSASNSIKELGCFENGDIALWLRNAEPKELDAEVLVIEMIACYGMPVGKTTFETCVWVGRFVEASFNLLRWHYIYRKDVKLHLCNSMRAKDGNVRQALIDKFPATGGGKTPQIGTKQKPGPLYGIKKDLWSALAIAITFAELNDGG